MGVKGSANRQRIVEAADRLFYSRGYSQTSFSDISDETGIPRGNFYYYFKTKEDILAAVIDARLDSFRHMLDACDDASDDPRQRLLMFVNVPLQNADNVIRYGCPVGTLSSELMKQQHQEISQPVFTAVFDLLRNWCINQFKALGLENRARDLAMDLLARLQGITIMSNVYGDRDFLRRATSDVQHWIKKVTAN
ncbi:MAG: TetR/AcrR family transcriptional regulator [Gammaproteobacteria bacterium]|nr:MAG: TetR/AcrR family transcriptional regulator [Gammaproteobacteria bacterium]